jgi:hypothetical protein
MERLRPDGARVTWRLLWPGGDAYRRPWPFYIEWDQPDDERLALDPPGSHPNGTRRVQEVAVLVQSLERGIDLYRRQLDLPFIGRGATPELAASNARFELEDCRVVLLTPSGPGPVAEALEASGEGVFQVVLEVDSLSSSSRWLAERGIVIGPAPDVLGGLLIEPTQALGARLVLREA